jgi:subtilisin family serine protease
VRKLSLKRLRVEPLEQRALLSCTLAPGPVAVDHLQVDPESYEPSSLLVRFRDDLSASAVDWGQLDQAGLAPGTRIGKAFSLVSGLREVHVDHGTNIQEALAAYRADPNVLYAEPNYRVHVAALPDDPQLSNLWGLENDGQTGGTPDADIDAALAWDVTGGAANTVVAVVDTGVDYTHEDLAANIWVNPGEIAGDGLDNDGNGFVDDVHGYDIVNGDGDPMDDHDHGTHVAGTIGAVGNNGLGVAGVNWSVQIMAVKFLDASGSGTLSDAVEAVNMLRKLVSG